MQGDFGAALAGQAKQTGEGAINQFNPQDVAGTQRSGFTGLFGSQMGTEAPQNSQQYYNKYAQTLGGMPQLQQSYAKANQMFNVPQLTQQAAQLRGQVAAIPSTVYNQARGFDYSTPQAQEAINYRQQFLNPQSQMATEQAQGAQNLAQQYVGYQQQQNQFLAQPVQQQGQMLSDALARQSSGFNIAAQNELQGLVARMNAGVTLSGQEYQRANQLLGAQEAYQQAIDSARIGQQYKTLTPGEALVSTGAIPGTNVSPYTPFAQTLAQFRQ